MHTNFSSPFGLVSRKRSAFAAGCRLLAPAVALLLTGCGILFPKESNVAELRKFASADELKAYLADRVEAEGSRQMWNRDFGGFAEDVALPGMGAANQEGSIPDSIGQGPSDGHSSTNIQEEGVDESDVVKNDGTYLYILSAGQLRIVRAVPADEMEIVSTVELAGQAQELYLREDTLVALGSGWVDGENTVTTDVTVLDISDHLLPIVTATIEAHGSLVTSRMIGSQLHLVLSVWPDLPEISGPQPILQSDLPSLIPDMAITDAAGGQTTRDLVGWQDIYHPVDPDGYHVTVVTTIDVDAPTEPPRSVAVMANVGTVYASTEALYLTDTDYDPWGRLREMTDIYKLDLTGDEPALAAAGSMPGRLLNRFSLGEHEGHLRAATTVGEVWRFGGSKATNNVYVLAQEGGDLNIVGKVEGIAPGEEIFSARFLGDRGFMVTFEKVDPLFTLDLSNPTDPRVVGELKVPGYSDYIHPLGENHLLTIGKDSVDVGDFSWYQGVQLSVFDVTDFANPQRVDVEIVGVRGTESEALRDPHAFNYFAPVETLAVPMSIYENADEEPSSYGELTFVGLCLYRVTAEEGIEPLGRVSTTVVDSEPRDWWWGYDYDWTRGVFIGDYVYAVTGSTVQALPLNDPEAAPIQLPLD